MQRGRNVDAAGGSGHDQEEQGGAGAGVESALVQETESPQEFPGPRQENLRLRGRQETLVR